MLIGVFEEAEVDARLGGRKCCMLELISLFEDVSAEAKEAAFPRKSSTS